VKNIRKQDGCWNCKHAFHEKNYSCPELYCTKNAPPRPRSPMEMKVYRNEDGDAWFDWCMGRGVGVTYICDDYEKGEV
jgi:hypothetical protein